VPGLSILVASAVVPLVFAMLNARDYGVVTPSLAGIENMHRYIVPSLKVVQRDAGEPDALLKELWHEERDLVSGRDPVYLALKLYEPAPAPDGFSENYTSLMRADKAYVRGHAGWLADVFLATFNSVMMTPPGNPFRGDAAPGGGIQRWLGIALKAAMFFSVLGFAVGWRDGSRSLVLFAAAFMGMVLGPALFIWWVGDRVRLPVDLLMLSFIAAALSDRMALCGFAAVALIAYTPCRLFQLPAAYFYGVGGLIAVGTALLMFRRSNQSRQSRGSNCL
jgi:hypothetical protein